MSPDSTWLAMLRCTNISPGATPVSVSIGTRLSAQPMNRKCGSCLPARRRKNSGSSLVTCATTARLLSKRRRRCSMGRSVARADRRQGEADGTEVDALQLRGLAEVTDEFQHVVVDALAVAAVELDPAAGRQAIEHRGQRRLAQERDALVQLHPGQDAAAVTHYGVAREAQVVVED